MVEQVYNVVGLSEVVLDVVIFGWYSELYKLILERSALLEKAMYFALDFHYIPISICCILSFFVRRLIGAYPS